MISPTDYLNAVRGMGIIGISLILLSVILAVAALVSASRRRVAQAARFLTIAWLPILLLFLSRVYFLKTMPLTSNVSLAMAALNMQNFLFAIYLPILLSILALLVLLIRRPAEAVRHTSLYAMLLLLATYVCLIVGNHVLGDVIQENRSRGYASDPRAITAWLLPISNGVSLEIGNIAISEPLWARILERVSKEYSDPSLILCLSQGVDLTTAMGPLAVAEKHGISNITLKLNQMRPLNSNMGTPHTAYEAEK